MVTVPGALCAAVAALVIFAVPVTVAQQPRATPSADELWRDYPLRDHPGHALPGTGPPANQTAPSSGGTTPASGGRSGSGAAPARATPARATPARGASSPDDGG